MTAPPFGIACAVEEASIVNLDSGVVAFSLVGAAFSIVVEANTAELLPLVPSSCTDPGTPTMAEDVVVSSDTVGEDEACRDGEAETAWLGAA